MRPSDPGRVPKIRETFPASGCLLGAMRVVRRALVLVLAVAASACVAQHRAGAPVPGARLSVGAESFVDDGPFRILFAGPEGDVESPREVTLSFSRPLRAVQTIDDDARPAPATVTRVHDGAAVRGSWRWFGGRTAVFWPTTKFASATAYRVVVDGSTRAFDGAALTSAPSFTFAGPRPAVTRAQYHYDEKTDEHLLEVDLNATVEPEALRTALRLEGKTAKGVSTARFHVVGNEAGDRQVLHLDREVASLEGAMLVASSSLTSIDGPLTSGVESRTAIPEIGPLRAEVVCNGADDEDTPKPKTTRCAGEDTWVTLRLSKYVATNDLERHLVVSAPAAPRPRDEYTPDTTNSLTLSQTMRLAPGGKYRVVLEAGLRAVDKEKLVADQVIDFSVADLVPHIAWRDIGRESVVEAARPAVVLEVGTMNVPAFDAVRAPLDDTALLTLLLAPARTAAHVRALPGSSPLRVTAPGAKNQDARARFDLPSTMRAAGAKGAFAIATSAKGIEDDVRILSVTDLGVTSKWSPHGGLVWVTQLSSATPVHNATVSLRRAWHPSSADAPVTSEEAFVTKTNAQGLATIPSQVAATFVDTGDGTPDAVLLVGDETGDRTYARLPRLDESLAHAIGDMFTDRKIYRPGETAFVKVVFRAPTPSGLVALVGRRATIEAYDDADHVIFASTAVLDAFGSCSVEVPIPRTARLGFATVRARVGAPGKTREGGRHHTRWASREWPAAAGFVIDEFRAIEIKVETASDRNLYVQGETAIITTRGTYLMGAPMHDVPAIIDVTRAPTSFHPEGLEGLSTDAHGLRRDDTTDRRLLSEQPPLGADGTVTTRIDLATVARRGPETVRTASSIADISRSFEVGDETSILVHPSDLYIGIRTAQDVGFHAGRPIRAEVAAARIDGTRKLDLPVRVQLLRVTSTTAKIKESFTLDTGKSCDARTAKALVYCEIVAPEPGDYWLLASALDSHGRTITAATSVFVSDGKPPPFRPDPPPVKVTPAPPAPPQLSFVEACQKTLPSDGWRQLTLDGEYRKVFAVGDTARLCLRGGGNELFTFEREGVLRHEFMPLARSGKLYDLPLTPELSPNVRIALHAVHGRSAPFPSAPARRADTGHPSASRDSVDLRVTAPEKKLLVAVEHDQEVRPGSDITMRVRVHDGANRPALAQITLWAVDEGVVLLRPFKVPELGSVFAEERGSDVVESDTRDLVFWEHIGMHQVKSPSIRQGSTSAGLGDHLARAKFRPTAFFFPSLVTGPDGVATVKATLPDNMTTWNVYAVATTVSDGFGEATSFFRTNKPLMARPALPRFLRVGDHVDAMVVIDSMSKTATDVKVSMRTSGVVTATKPGAVVAFTVPPEGHVPVSFAIDAGTVGKGAITFRVETKDKKLTDEVTIEEDVSIPATLETVVVSGETKRRADEPLGDLSRARTDVGSFDFRLASSPIIGLAESLGGLVEYPYGCTEQLTSRLVPLVRLRSLARELAVPLPGDLDASVRGAIGSLLSHQRADGGFGFWPASRKSEPWLTILAVNALTAAGDAGYAVPTAPVARATTYLDGAEIMDASERALLEDVYASHATPREKELRRLADEASKPGMPAFARALVAHALAKVDRDLGKRILGGVAAQARITGGAAMIGDERTFDSRRHLSSDTRTTALVLRAFLALDPKNPLVAKLVRGLLAQRHDGRWSTTQASAWALLALDEARAEFPTNVAMNAHLSLDGAEIARGSSAAGSVPMARLAKAQGAALSFTVEGGASLFYEGVLRYARKDPPTTPLEHGISVVKTMRVLRRDGMPPAKERSDFRVGDYVEVIVTLATPVSRELVVLADPLPAGFEAVNQSYANASRQTFYSDVSHDVTHRELRDDRVVTFFDRLPAGTSQQTRYLLRVMAGGRYVVPPTKAECMYAPDVFGRTAASVVDAAP